MVLQFWHVQYLCANTGAKRVHVQNANL
jgi:hypothetical protein